MKTLLVLFATVSIMAHRTDHSGNLRLSLWDGESFRSGIMLKNSAPFAWYKAHVSRDSVATFGETDAETVQVSFAGDTIREVR